MRSELEPFFRGFFCRLLIVMLWVPLQADVLAQEQTPVPQLLAVVDDNVLSTYDLEQLSRLILQDMEREVTPEALAEIRPRAWELLRDLSIFSTFAEVQSQASLETAFTNWYNNYLQSINVSEAMMRTQMTQNAISYPWYKDWMRRMFVWQSYLQSYVSDRVEISQYEIAHELQRRERLARVGGYRLSMILLEVPVEASSEVFAEAQTRALGYIADLERGESFETLSRLHSPADIGDAGGSLGWVAAPELSPTLRTVVEQTEVGAVHKSPVRVERGVAVIRLEEKVTQSAVESWELKRVGIDRPEAISALASGQWRCSDVGKGLAEDYPELADKGLGSEQTLTLEVNSLSEELQGALRNRSPGDAVGPFGSGEDQFMLIVCAQVASEVDRGPIEQSLREIQSRREIEQLQNRLRSQASIEPIGFGLEAPFAGLLGSSQ